ncbi:MAG: Crp/Fnr family transcriptional regulator [Cytophagaceae bacterium]
MEENINFQFEGTECSLFKDLDEDRLNQLNKIRQIKVLKKGDFIYTEGSVPNSVFALHSGHIKAFKIGSDGKEQIIYLSKPGDLVGWQQLTCNDPYSTSAVALERAVISEIDKAEFIRLIENTPVSLALTHYICEDVVMLETKVLELSQKSVRERLATNIILLYEKFGMKNENTLIIGIPLTREDFANLIGTNTETVIKLLSEFRKEGHIDIIDKKIIIINMTALRKMSDFYR